MVDFKAMLERNQGISSSVSLLKANIIRLPYAERREADELVQKWLLHRRLSQLEQLRVDQLIAEIDSIKEKTHGTSTDPV